MPMATTSKRPSLFKSPKATSASDIPPTPAVTSDGSGKTAVTVVGERVQASPPGGEPGHKQIEEPVVVVVPPGHAAPGGVTVPGGAGHFDLGGVEGRVAVVSVHPKLPRARRVESADGQVQVPVVVESPRAGSPPSSPDPASTGIELKESPPLLRATRICRDAAPIARDDNVQAPVAVEVAQGHFPRLKSVVESKDSVCVALMA